MIPSKSDLVYISSSENPLRGSYRWPWLHQRHDRGARRLCPQRFPSATLSREVPMNDFETGPRLTKSQVVHGPPSLLLQERTGQIGRFRPRQGKEATRSTLFRLPETGYRVLGRLHH